MEQAEGKNQNLADKQIALAGGGTLKFTILTSGGYGVQIQSQGVNCLLYTSWQNGMTGPKYTAGIAKSVIWDIMSSDKNFMETTQRLFAKTIYHNA